jgi:2-methylcitrate dehydratase PrpD
MVSSKFAEGLIRPVTQADRDRAALLLLDWTACAVAGRAEAVGQKITDAFPSGSGPCTRIGATTASPQMAAFHNGCLGNVLEMDDVDKRAVLHAAPTVIPAALAMAEYVGASADDFLDAIVIGYEATIRIGRAVGPGHYAFWHNTATCGPFGAAAAACHLLKRSDLVSALGLAGTQAAGLWQTRHEPDSDAKQIHAGHAAQVGVQAAMLSAQGVQGPRSILEGEQGFFKAMCPGADPQDVLAEYGGGWLIHQTSIKPYAACRHAHAAIDAALLAREAGVSEGDVVVETYADALKFCDRPNPTPGREAKFSLQHAVAWTLQHGEPGLGDFDANALAKTQKSRATVRMEATDEFNTAYPAHYGGAVTVGGQRFVAKDALGDPEKPLTQDQVIAKANALLAHGGMHDTDSLIHAALVGSPSDIASLLS